MKTKSITAPKYYYNFAEAMKVHTESANSDGYTYCKPQKEDMPSRYKPYVDMGCKVIPQWTLIHSGICTWCIVWKGVKLRLPNVCGSRYDSTFELSLAEDYDAKGTDVYYSNYQSYISRPAPNKIGVPTAKKLDDWLDWLLEKRAIEEHLVEHILEQRDYYIKLVRSNLPDAEIRPTGYKDKFTPFDASWTTEYRKGGITYTATFSKAGIFTDDIKLDYDLNCACKSAKMATMCNSGYEPSTIKIPYIPGRPIKEQIFVRQKLAHITSESHTNGKFHLVFNFAA